MPHEPSPAPQGLHEELSSRSPKTRVFRTRALAILSLATCLGLAACQKEEGDLKKDAISTKEGNPKKSLPKETTSNHKEAPIQKPDSIAKMLKSGFINQEIDDQLRELKYDESLIESLTMQEVIYENLKKQYDEGRIREKEYREKSEKIRDKIWRKIINHKIRLSTKEIMKPWQE